MSSSAALAVPSAALAASRALAFAAALAAAFAAPGLREETAAEPAPLSTAEIAPEAVPEPELRRLLRRAAGQ